MLKNENKSLQDIPSSVYRLQFNEEFPLKKAINVLPYLNDLGIDGIYCSPLFESASSHGYDVLNPNRLNPLIGTMEEFDEFCALCQKLNIKQVHDVIPNHMGIKGRGNTWWLDVLEKGKNSSYADFFDIDWAPAKIELKDKILLPILKSSYGEDLESGEIKLIWEDGFWIAYQDYRLPIFIPTYPFILECQDKSLSTLESGQENDWLRCLAISNQIKNLGAEEKKDLQLDQKQQLIALYNESSFIRLRIDQILSVFNGKKGEMKSFDLLHELLEKQHYRLSNWLVAGQEINYRRFFNINELVAIHIEKEKVLNAHHRWVFNLLESKKIQGVRIDHPDGLYDPNQYFERINAKKPPLVIAEKILNFNEPLPEKWDVDGTVGYDFLNVLNGVFIEKNNEKKFDATYEKFIGYEMDLKSVLFSRKKSFINFQMGAEINFLGVLIDEISEKNIYFRDFTKADLTYALKEVIAHFPVYRTYIKPEEEPSNKDREYVHKAFEMAIKKAPEIDKSIFDYLRSLLLLEFKHEANEKEEVFDFILRFQQLTAPVMAKGLEDSTYFIYNRFISLNEVGSDPKYFGCSKAEFHQFNSEKLSKWKLGFLSSSTHDSKYSEDVHMRLSVLSEIPQKWEEQVIEWKELNKKFKKKFQDGVYPEDNLEYYIYQMLIGIWPETSEEYSSSLFLERIWTVLHKILREAGMFTSWRHPNLEYEEAVKEFFFALTTSNKDNQFLRSFMPFQKEIARYGSWNSLSQFLLKIGSCGIVDIYQGNESWKLCLMDPDNRRNVDYDSLQKKLASLSNKEILSLNDSSHDKLKLFIATKALNFRKSHKELFLDGEYIPLETSAENGENILAFMRKINDKIVICASARFFTKLATGTNDLPLGEKCWKGSYLLLPKDFEDKKLYDVFTGRALNLHLQDKRLYLSLALLFESFPFAMLTNIRET